MEQTENNIRKADFFNNKQILQINKYDKLGLQIRNIILNYMK